MINFQISHQKTCNLFLIIVPIMTQLAAGMNNDWSMRALFQLYL